MILGYTPSEYASLLVRNNLTQTIVDEYYARSLNTSARSMDVRVKTHIKLDTGMSRLGIFAQGKKAAICAAEVVERICRLPYLENTGLFTHFSVADNPDEDGYTNWQSSNYRTVLDVLAKKGLHPGICHVSNSACILDHPEIHMDMVRAGIMLYGMNPDGINHRNSSLMPVMTLKSRVVQVRSLVGGSMVSYGRVYRCPKDTDIAVISAGYADRYSRRLSGKGVDFIRGKEHRQIGCVCMDMHMIQSDGKRIKRGDEVILWGNGGMSTEQVADYTGTISHEVTCLVPPRVPRVYIE